MSFFAKSRMAKVKLVYAVVFIMSFLGLSHQSNVYAQVFLEDYLYMPTDSRNGKLFLHNPAGVSTDQVWITYGRQSSLRRSKVTALTGGGAEQRSFRVSDVNHGFGFMSPLGGGAAFGLSGQYLGRDLEADNENRSEVSREVFRRKQGSAKFVVDLTADIRTGRNDRSDYFGRKTGYVVGVYYDKGDWGVGIANSPPMRGKASVMGEEKIIALPAKTTLESHYTYRGFVVGASVERWYYQRDDRSLPSTSSEDQRRISLNGLDIDQFLHDVEAISVCVDRQVRSELLLRGGVSQRRASFLFDGNIVPGHDPNRERALMYYLYHFAGAYVQNDFRAELQWSLFTRKVDDFSDNLNWHGTGRYEAYESKGQSIMVTLSFVK